MKILFNKNTISIALISLLFFGCVNNKMSSQDQPINKLEDINHNKVLVVAHRGDWRNAPENSLQAIQNCIDMGVDMVEIDLKRTKDGEIIVMHDKTLERTATGKGLIKSITLDSISKLHLKNGYGMATHYKIPTLKEALTICKGKILVFLDKGYQYIPEAMKIVKELEMENQVFFEGKVPIETLKSKYKALEDLNYMPRVNLSLSDKVYLDSYLNQKKQSIFIFSFKKKAVSDMKYAIEYIKEVQGKVMLTTLWDSTCGGYTDDLALIDPDENWGKVIDLGADLICTDRPMELIVYLRQKGLHN